ncbi:S24 family peptidase [Capnocytophaga leadbetteri]|uniref:S24 family peptidase n=1 Tax=Capnocytophaga leadbetteri TaxID=327575 RepID=UPI0028E472AC|nr:S24 family peptidase [Capnocytophaga leadbetteri]
MENNLDTEQNSVKNRLLQFLEHKNISQKRFEEMCGLSNGYVNNIRKSIKLDTYKEKIEPIFPELNKKWLLLGEGEMLIEEEEEEPYLRAERNKYGLSLQRIQELTNLPLKTLKAYDNGSKEMPDDILEAFDNLFQRIENEYNEREEENTAIPVLITDDMVSNVKVPFYEVDFAGGFTSPEMFSEVKPSFVISSPSFSGADFACVLTGNSMSRRIKNGSVIGLKKINEWWEYFPTNEIYAIVTKNGLRTVKIVKRSSKSGYIDLIPDPLPEYNNPPYETETIRMEYVIGFYQVVAHAFFERMSF